MFYLNVGYKWNLLGESRNIKNIIVLPSGNDRGRLSRKDFPNVESLLFDPQLYLCALDASECKKVCTRLSTYPWFFSDEVEDFSSDDGKHRNWLKEIEGRIEEIWKGASPERKDYFDACYDCITFQNQIKCTEIILPSPLVTDREDEFEIQSEWIDAGIAAAEDADATRPLLATIALDESIFSSSSAFAPNGYIDSIVDQVTSREDISGVYIVIAQTSAASHPNNMPESVVKGYLTLCARFGRHYDRVLVNFAGILGKIASGMGASGYAFAPAHNTRRFCLDSYKDEGGGKALPYYFSNRSAVELLSETGLDEIVKRDLITFVEDRTPFSKELLEVLNEGGSAKDVPDWVESQNNTVFAHKHFVYRLAFDQDRHYELNRKKKLKAIKDWLKRAIANQTYLKSNGITTNLGHFIPAKEWLDIFEQIGRTGTSTFYNK